MKRYHLMHCIPHPRAHGLNGYNELMETVAWGLDQLGHPVSFAVNRYEPEATNIIFGAHMLPLDVIQRMPADSIVYSLEQARNLKPEDLPTPIRCFAERFEIWDYSAANLQAWRDLGTTRVKLVPVGYSPVLTRIPRAVHQDIDVLLYGMTGAERLEALHHLSHAGLTVVFVSGLYGAARDELISRSKVVLNVNLYKFAQIFEVVRVSYLFANRKAVIATRDPHTFVETDIESAVLFSRVEDLVENCRRVVEDEKCRLAFENKGFEVMKQRDIRAILRPVLAGSPQ